MQAVSWESLLISAGLRGHSLAMVELKLEAPVSQEFTCDGHVVDNPS